MANKTVNIPKALTRYQFADEDGDVFAWFHMNPLDIRIAQRAAASAERFEEIAKAVGEGPTVDDLIRWDKEITEEINNILGYDASGSLFGLMSATTILPDGRCFAAVVLETISENLEADIRGRISAQEAAVKKHTAKYE